MHVRGRLSILQAIFHGSVLLGHNALMTWDQYNYILLHQVKTWFQQGVYREWIIGWWCGEGG